MTYNQVIPSLYESLNALGANRPELVVLRNMQGRISLILREEVDESVERRLEKAVDSLGPWAAQRGGRIIPPSKAYLFGDVFSDPTLMIYVPEAGGWEMRILHRLVTGSDWLAKRPSIAPRPARAPRIVFYGLKGGVGRSTALAVAAYRLAQEGKNVLLVDFDLESPGLSSLLLPPERRADFGVVDYMIESTVDPSWAEWGRMINRSPLRTAPGIIGRIGVVGASGGADDAYLEKLSRAYQDLTLPGEGIRRFSDRALAMIEGLESEFVPDVVLIDSRAGLHDLAATIILGIADLALLFAVNSNQTWDGYEYLFSHWLKCPATARVVRERLQIVDALFPSMDREGRISDFLAHSFDLFSILYDEIAADEPEMPNAFSFAIEDPDAPHAPWRFFWRSELQEFNPVKDFRENTRAEIEASYGAFLNRLMIWLGQYGTT